VGHFERKFYIDVDEEWCSCKSAAESFHTKKLYPTSLDRSSILLAKQKNRVLCPWGLRGNVYGLSMTRWKARNRLPIDANWTSFATPP